MLKVLLQEELEGRERSATGARRAAAGFPTGKTFAAWDAQLCSVPIATQEALRSLEWVRRRENLVVCGPSGTGKSFFLDALGQEAVENGLKVAWFTLEGWGSWCARAWPRLSLQWITDRGTCQLDPGQGVRSRADLIVVDDIGLLPVSPDSAEGHYRLVDSACERRSVAISSNLHPAGFDELMPKTLATATVDRLMHRPHLCVTSGESIRLAEATSGQGVLALSVPASKSRLAPRRGTGS